jgi:hypothetical protein
MIYYDYLVILVSKAYIQYLFIQYNLMVMINYYLSYYLNLDNTNTDNDLKLDVNLLCYDKDFKLVNN